MNVSVLIPARKERFLNQTIRDVLENGDNVQVVVCLDGYWPDEVIEDERLIYIHSTERRGMRAVLNMGVEVAAGEFVMKLDAHCKVSPGFDTILSDICQPNWVCIPTRKRLDAENWCVKKDSRPDINYQFIDLSNDGLNGKEWREKNRDRSLDSERVVNAISCQGSCYFMHKSHWRRLGLLDEEHYGTFRKDPQEVMFKTWTSHGRCVRVKDCWYAHLHKGRKYGRMYHLDMTDYRKGDEFVKQWWTDSAWDERQTIPLHKVFRCCFSDMPGWADHPWMQRDPTISICIPCMNRRDDLEQILPQLIATAEASPPVEIVVIDYNSGDGVGKLVAQFPSVVYRRYEGRDTYHMAHARNLSVKASSGDYVLISSADIIITPSYIRAIREQIAQGCVWMHPSDRFVGVVCARRDEFEAAGGFDERFEFYGKEDKDLRARLLRRGTKHGAISDTDLSLIYTPWDRKLLNYRPGVGRREMHKKGKRIYEENCAAGVLVANEGREWGSWE